MNPNRGMKYDFPFINIRKVPREVLKTEGKACILCCEFEPGPAVIKLFIRLNSTEYETAQKHKKNGNKGIMVSYYPTH